MVDALLHSDAHREAFDVAPGKSALAGVPGTTEHDIEPDGAKRIGDLEDAAELLEAFVIASEKRDAKLDRRDSEVGEPESPRPSCGRCG